MSLHVPVRSPSPCHLLIPYSEGSPLARDWSDDQRLIGEFQQGNEAALESVYDRYATLAYTLARTILADSQAAEDVVQEAFLSAWRNSERFDPARSSLRSWLMTIVRRRCFDRLRGMSVRPQLDPEADVAEGAGSSDVWREVEDALTAQHVRSALAQLPIEQRQTIEFAYYGGLSQTEIAERMQVPLGTVKGRIRIGFDKLRGLLANLELDALG